ncbi:MAG: hypothetical protein WCK86_13775 [Planctomycetia bacterium]
MRTRVGAMRAVAKATTVCVKDRVVWGVRIDYEEKSDFSELSVKPA